MSNRNTVLKTLNFSVAGSSTMGMADGQIKI